MVARSFRARVGRQRIAKSVNPIEASYTRSIREQMKQVEENISAVVNELKDVTADVLDEALRPTFEKALIFTPVDSGDLKASGFLETRSSQNRVQAELGFGKGGKPEYAVFVHERTDLNHKAPTKAKFLQAAIEEDLDDIPGRLVKAYKEKTGI